MKGKVHPYRTANLKSNHRITYQHSLSLFDTSVTEDERNDKPLPMLFSVANQLDQERLLCHAQGGKSRPFRCED
jgi:hypothetical protein